MASIEKIKTELKPWTPRNGGARYYVNDWKAIIGLHVEYYKSGNVSDVWFDEKAEDDLEGVSNCAYRKYISGTKVWFDEDANLHIDHLDSDFETVRARILRYVDEAFSEPAPAVVPATPRQLIQMSLCAFLR